MEITGTTVALCHCQKPEHGRSSPSPRCDLWVSRRDAQKFQETLGAALVEPSSFRPRAGTCKFSCPC
uniref:Uncharacterized protein n=1 Tax=Arundo donax TaxID=35708 RepID=A0A0A9DGX2_ARUDO